MNGSRSHFRRLWLGYAVLMFSLGLTISASLVLDRDIRRRQWDRFNSNGQVIFDNTEQHLGFFLKLLEGVRGLFVERVPEPDDVRAYFRSIDVYQLERESGLEGVGLVWRVTAENQQEFLDYFASRNITNITASWKTIPGEHFPIADLESNYPEDDTVLGWDVANDRVRLEALRRAKETGQPTLTPKVRLFLPKAGRTAEGFILYVPIFSGGSIPENEEERDKKLIGYVFGSFNTDKFFRGLVGHRESILDVEIFDQSINRGNLLFDDDRKYHDDDPTPPGFEGRIQGDLFGRTWIFYFSERPSLWSPEERGLPRLVLCGGIVISLCFFGLVCLQSHGRKLAEGLNEQLRQSKGDVERTLANTQKAEESLAREKERLTVTLRSIGDAVVTTDIHGRITLMNSAAEKLSECAQREAQGRPIEEVWALHECANRARVKHLSRSVLGSGVPPVPSKLLLQTRSGKEVALQYNGAPIREGEGQIIGAVFVFQNITEELKVEAERLKSSKLESIGLLAGGIAHDFNNILTAIIGNVSYLRHTGMIPPEADTRLDEVQKASFRAKGLTQQLLTFAKGGAPIKQTASITEIIRESSEFALRGSNVRAEYSFTSDLPRVEVDATQMSQVIQNLVINATQAMAGGGLIEITGTEKLIPGPSDIPLNPGRYVLISVRDHGTGIAPENMSKIFDPYFTTKPAGTGLGLATAYSILRRHDGLITVESSAGEGTVFHIYLPAATGRFAQPEPVPAMDKPSQGAGRILALDDEEPIRTLISVLLRHFGYEVQTAENGAEAIEKYTQAMRNGARFDAVIMDLTVPGGMGGREALHHISRIDPKVRAIVSSGYSSDPVMSDFRSYGFSAVIEKPYKMDELGRVVAEVLRGPHSV